MFLDYYLNFWSFAASLWILFSWPLQRPSFCYMQISTATVRGKHFDNLHINVNNIFLLCNLKEHHVVLEKTFKHGILIFTILMRQ